MGKLSIFIIMGLIIALSFMRFEGTGEDQERLDQVYDAIEASVQKEAGFYQAEEALRDLERMEQGVFQEMRGLNNDDEEELQEQGERAAMRAEERTEIMQEAQEKVERAYKHLFASEEAVEALESVEVRDILTDMMKTASERKEHHVAFVEAYIEESKASKETYLVMADTGFEDRDKYEEKLTEVMTEAKLELPKVIEEERETFNELTEELRMLQREFYDKAGYDVEIEEEVTEGN